MYFKTSYEIAKRFEDRKGELKLSLKTIQKEALVSRKVLEDIRWYPDNKIDDVVWGRIAKVLKVDINWLLIGKELKNCDSCYYKYNSSLSCPAGCRDFSSWAPILENPLPIQEPKIAKISEIYQLTWKDTMTAEIKFDGRGNFERVAYGGAAVIQDLDLEDWQFMGMIAKEVEKIAGGK